jgi:hypothetical protein
VCSSSRITMGELADYLVQHDSNFRKYASLQLRHLPSLILC